MDKNLIIWIILGIHSNLCVKGLFIACNELFMTKHVVEINAPAIAVTFLQILRFVFERINNK